MRESRKQPMYRQLTPTLLNFGRHSTTHLSPSTGQLSSNPAPTLAFSNALPVPNGHPRANGSGPPPRQLPLIANAAGPGSSAAPVPSTPPADKSIGSSPSLQAQPQPTSAPPTFASKLCEELARVALSGLPLSRFRMDPNFLSELGMDSNTSVEGFVESLLAKAGGEEKQSPEVKETGVASVEGSGVQCSRTRSPCLGPSSVNAAVQASAVGSLQAIQTSEHTLQHTRSFSDPPGSHQSTGKHACPCCGYKDVVSSSNGPTVPQALSEQPIDSPFISAPPEPTLNQIGLPASSPNSHYRYESGYSKNYYKAFWKPGDPATLNDFDKHQRHKSNSAPKKRSKVDEDFLAAITPYFADETYRLGNVDRLTVPRVEERERQEIKVDLRGRLKEKGVFDNEDPLANLASTSGEQGSDSESTSVDSELSGSTDGLDEINGSEHKVHAPLENGDFAQGRRLKGSRKRTRHADMDHRDPQQKKSRTAGHSVDEELTADEFFASIFRGPSEGKTGRDASDLSDPLPLPLTANDDTKAWENLREEEQVFAMLLSSSEIEEAYQSFESGSSTGSKTDWLALA